MHEFQAGRTSTARRWRNFRTVHRTNGRRIVDGSTSKSE
jgi:hypothetical protein